MPANWPNLWENWDTRDPGGCCEHPRGVANLKEQADVTEVTPISAEPDRTCTRCGKTKPATAFHRTRHRRRSRCAQCISETRPPSNRPKPTPEENRRYQMAKYGITQDQYEQMEEAQGKVCAICQQPQAGRLRLAVDHCHETGRVRALLCATCNGGLGLYEQHLKRPKDYAGYLARYGNGNPLLGYEGA